ncbi:methionyl-tRNA formyltransferase [Patescibacteria group bacterium]|nr:methionyl-tRNA formyltransferase [Patescibacteria group bacterium]
MQNNKTKFVFFGTGDFAARILDYLHKNDIYPMLIVTTPDKPRGRKMLLTPPPVKLWAQKNNIKTITDYSLLSILYSLFIVADYGKIIPKEILNIPKYGALNIHPSLLPKFRGPSPIQSFILSGEEKTGVTIIKMAEKVDAGPIVAISNFKSQILNLYYKELEAKLAELGAKLLIETLPKWIKQEIKPQEQDHSQATYTKKITKEDGLIKTGDSPEIIDRKVRAFTPWPGVYFFVYPPKCKSFGGQDNKKIRIIITKSEIKNGKLIIKRIKPEGKNEMPFNDFLKGNKDLEPQIQKLTN